MLKFTLPELPSYRPLLFKALLKRAASAPLSPFSLSVSRFSFQETKVAHYRDFFDLPDESFPLPYLFVATQAAQLYLFTHPKIAVRPLGLVHMGVEFESFSVIDTKQSFQFELSLTSQAQTKRGRTFELTGVLKNGDVVVAQYRSQYLMPGQAKGNNTSNKPNKSQNEALDPVSPWHTITVSDARQYARLSGDYNPIHLSRWLSPLFGFKQPIAHGMYMVGKLYAKAIHQNTESAPTRFKVSFCRPLLLPSPTYLSRSPHSLCLLTAKKKPCVEVEL